MHAVNHYAASTYLYTLKPSDRPGAQDAFKVPSLINGVTVPVTQRVPDPTAVKV